MKYLQKGDQISADWLRELVREVRRNRIQPGHGVRLTQSDNGSVLSLAGKLRVSQPYQSDPYPYGASWNFGVAFADATIEVYAGLVYNAGVAIAWPGAVPGTPSVTGLANDDFVCVVLDYDAGTIGIDKRSTLSDTDGDIIRVLCQVQVISGVASLKKWYWPNAEIGAKGKS